MFDEKTLRALFPFCQCVLGSQQLEDMVTCTTFDRDVIDLGKKPRQALVGLVYRGFRTKIGGLGLSLKFRLSF